MNAAAAGSDENHARQPPPLANHKTIVKTYGGRRRLNNINSHNNVPAGIFVTPRKEQPASSPEKQLVQTQQRPTAAREKQNHPPVDESAMDSPTALNASPKRRLGDSVAAAEEIIILKDSYDLSFSHLSPVKRSSTTSSAACSPLKPRHGTRRTRQMQSKSLSSLPHSYSGVGEDDGGCSKAKAVLAAELSALLLSSSSSASKAAATASKKSSEAIVQSASVKPFKSAKSLPQQPQLNAVCHKSLTESNSPVKSLVRNFHDLKQSGENQLLNDDLLYLLDGFDQRHPMQIRRYGMVEFTVKCLQCSPAQFQSICRSPGFFEEHLMEMISADNFAVNNDLVCRWCLRLIVALVLDSQQTAEMFFHHDTAMAWSWLARDLLVVFGGEVVSDSSANDFIGRNASSDLETKKRAIAAMIAELKDSCAKRLSPPREPSLQWLALQSFTKAINAASCSRRRSQWRQVLRQNCQLYPAVQQLMSRQLTAAISADMSLWLTICHFCTERPCELSDSALNSCWQLLLAPSPYDSDLCLASLKLLVNLTHHSAKDCIKNLLVDKVLLCLLSYAFGTGQSAGAGGAEEAVDDCNLLALACLINIIDRNDETTAAMHQLKLGSNFQPAPSTAPQWLCAQYGLHWQFLMNHDDNEKVCNGGGELFERRCAFTTYLAYLLGTLIISLPADAQPELIELLPDGHANCLISPLQKYAQAHQQPDNNAADESDRFHDSEMVQSFQRLSAALSFH